MDDLLDETALLTRLDDELRAELDELLAGELLAGKLLAIELLTIELVVPHVPVTPKGEGWLVQVLVDIQLFWFSQPQPLCVETHTG